ncbi:hypothetical protein ACI65C_010469 [Semiaphis heraclei]
MDGAGSLQRCRTHTCFFGAHWLIIVAIASRPTGGGSERQPQPTSVVASSFPYIATHKGPRARCLPTDADDNRHSHQTRRRRRSFDTVYVCVCVCSVPFTSPPSFTFQQHTDDAATTAPPSPHHHRILGPRLDRAFVSVAAAAVVCPPVFTSYRAAYTAVQHRYTAYT